MESISAYASCVVKKPTARSTSCGPRCRVGEDLEITERSKTAVSTQEAVETVRLTEGTIGFGPYTRLLESAHNVLRIDGLHPSDPGYPSSSEFAYVYKAGSLTQDAEKFIAFTRVPDASEVDPRLRRNSGFAVSTDRLERQRVARQQPQCSPHPARRRRA